MYAKQEIILKSHREGKSQRQIARDLQISRKTVKKYLEAYETLQDSAPGEASSNAFIAYLTTPPKYAPRPHARRVLSKDMIGLIDQCLSENRDKVNQGQRKQVLKKIDIFEKLQANGFNVGYTTVCNYIRNKCSSPSVKEAFVRQSYQPGGVCEFDWSEVKLELNGVQARLYMAVFTSAYSNLRYSLIFHRQDTLAFMESHALFFAHVGGVYHQMVYDNMRVAVARFVGPHEKEPTVSLMQMRGHYQFSHRFCNVRSGNEKGHVERSVEYIRRKAFGPKHTFSSLEEAQTHLHQVVDRLNHSRQQLTGRSAVELFQEEKSALYACPPPLACYESMRLRVDKYATICYGTNHYSVPDHLVDRHVDVKIYGNKLEVFSQNDFQAKHPRCFARHQWIIAIEHYLETFRRKPGALASSVALVSNLYLKSLYDKYFKESPRDFIDLLQFCTLHNVDQTKLEDVVNRLLRLCSQRITGEKITALLGNKPPDALPQVDEASQTTIHSKRMLLELTAMLN